MRILHLCLANYYIDGYRYQENVLARVNAEDGNDVRIIASTETFVDNRSLGYVQPSEYMTEYGVPIERLPYKKVGTHFMTIKLRYYQGLYDRIKAFAPDVIMAHGANFGSVVDVIRYKREHPEVKLFVDTHAWADNSGKNWLSLHVLHRIFYRRLMQKTIPYMERFFYPSIMEKRFSIENYGVPEDIMEFFPLGSDIPSPEAYAQARARRREELGVQADELLFVHSGKLEKEKRTKELLLAFAAVPALRAKMAVIGSIPEERREELMSLIEKDERVVYLGWKPSEELQEYLCACDLYLQPGTVSITMQNAVCCGCPVLIYPHEAYRESFDYQNLIWAETEEDMADAFRQVADGTIDLDALKRNSIRCAEELLDYRKLARRLYA